MKWNEASSKKLSHLVSKFHQKNSFFSLLMTASVERKWSHCLLPSQEIPSHHSLCLSLCLSLSLSRSSSTKFSLNLLNILLPFFFIYLFYFFLPPFLTSLYVFLLLLRMSSSNAFFNLCFPLPIALCLCQSSFSHLSVTLLSFSIRLCFSSTTFIFVSFFLDNFKI